MYKIILMIIDFTIIIKKCDTDSNLFKIYKMLFNKYFFENSMCIWNYKNFYVLIYNYLLNVIKKADGLIWHLVLSRIVNSFKFLYF